LEPYGRSGQIPAIDNAALPLPANAFDKEMASSDNFV
jgi:hypothetical protein